MGRPWGRLYSGMRNHRRIVALSRRHPTHWRVIYTLLEMSFESWEGGKILAAPGIPYTLAELAEEVRLSPLKLLAVLETMDELGLIKLEPYKDNRVEEIRFDRKNAKITTISLHFCNWNERQYDSDLSTNRTQKHKAKSKKSGAYETPGTAGERSPERPGNGAGNAPETETDTDKRLDNSLATIISPPSGLINLWNEIWPHPLMKRAIQPTQRRIDKAKTRLEYNPTRAYWTEVFTKVKETPFLNGTGKPWRGGKAADLDWLLANDENHVKVWEGKYDDKGKSGGGSGGNPAPSKFDGLGIHSSNIKPDKFAGLGTFINIDEPEDEPE
jgi:hypothetical protein